jgi:hypothetical protein
MFCLPGRDKAEGSVWGQPLAKGFQVFLPRRFSQADHLARKCLPAAFQPLRMVQRFPCRNVVKIAVLETNHLDHVRSAIRANHQRWPAETGHGEGAMDTISNAKTSL